MIKEDLVLALLNEGVEGWMETAVPEIPSLPAPSESDATVNSFVLASYAVNCNTFLQLFSGLKLFDFLLRGLQRSNPMIALAMASVEGSNLGSDNLLILSPDNDAVCQGYVRIVAKATIDVTGVDATVGTLTRNMNALGNGIFELRIPLPAGPYNLSVHGQGADITVTRTFSISDYEHDPGDQYISIGNYLVLIAMFGSSDLIASVSAKITGGDEIMLARDLDENFDGYIDFPEGQTTLDFHIYPAAFPDYHVTQVVVAEAQ